MAQLNSYINFDGNCREAINFYKKCFRGELNISTIKDTLVTDGSLAGMLEQVMHSSLIKNSFIRIASDMTRPEGFRSGNNFAVSLSCRSEEEINRLYRNLSEGGQIIDPLKQQFWGVLFAVVIDKFNIPWLLNYDSQNLANFSQQ